MTKDEALKMAIETMESTKLGDMALGLAPSIILDDTINACKEALEQQEIGDAEIKQMLNDIEYYQKRVEELEQSTWQGLTDDEIDALEGFYDYMTPEEFVAAIRGVEAKLKEKNT
jgi:hypothetical protein